MCESKQTHPWEMIIKDNYRSHFKWAHNSIHNPEYPSKKIKLPDKNRVKLTIVGNRTTKEFIYCSHLVRTLYKYRPQAFDAPLITGVTSVEWPKIWNDLKIKYGDLAYCLQNQVAVILNGKFLGGDKELRDVLESRYNYPVTLDYLKEAVASLSSFIQSSGRSCAYLHIGIDDEHIGSLIFMLYSDIVPYTCENFLRLCQTKKGGYSGTPIHRIVKDGWIQCGGFGLKNWSNLDCENFIVPHDRRGVLCMANDGRHTDCSTQFFVVLQPALWMAHKYVAFGQLIDGESTLKKIEAVPTFYESPLRNIFIENAGILNLEYQDIRISKTTNEYLEGHIDDLVALGDLLYEELLLRVYCEIELKYVVGTKEEVHEEQKTMNIHATARFIRKKEDIEKLRNDQSNSVSSVGDSDDNNEFDVEIYEFEPEQSYQYTPLVVSSEVIKPVKPFYLPLTDVPYPGEIDSTHDLKKYLRGDFCLESDLIESTIPYKKNIKAQNSFTSDVYEFDENSVTASVESLSTDDEQEIRRYIKLNVDRVSFAGGVVKTIARGVAKTYILDITGGSDLITDEELRRFRVASNDHRLRVAQEKKVSISIASSTKEPSKIKRRQTGFVRNEDLEKIYLIRNASSQDLEPKEDESLTETRKVRIAESGIVAQTGTKTQRKPTGFPPKSDVTNSDADVRRKSALSRLYDDISVDSDEGPTLKDYRPSGRSTKPKTFFLTQSPMVHMKKNESTKNIRRSVTIEDRSFEQVLNLQHGRQTVRKISSDYVKTIDQIEQRNPDSIRSVEYSKSRPSLTVHEYQKRNMKNSKELESRSLIHPEDHRNRTMI